MQDFTHKFSNNEASKNFILGGNAIFTIRNEDTLNRFTFKVVRKKRQQEHEKPIYWIKVLTRSDNNANESYTFIGAFSKERGFTHSLKSYITVGALSVKVAEYYFKRLFDNTLPAFINTYHEGRCGRCGRLLTVPESIEDGFGSECKQIINKQKSNATHQRTEA